MKAIAEAAGKEPKIVLYDPAAVDIEKGKGFPFRCEPLHRSRDRQHCIMHVLQSNAAHVDSLTNSRSEAVCERGSYMKTSHAHAWSRPSPATGANRYASRRTAHFFASADKAKRMLGWYPEHNFLMDVAERVEAYKASGRLDKEIDFSTDDKILAAVGH